MYNLIFLSNILEVIKYLNPIEKDLYGKYLPPPSPSITEHGKHSP